MNCRAPLLAAALGLAASTALADPVKILFVGNSYTFGRVDPVLSYNAAEVHDLTAAFNAVSSAGSNPYEPHPWGGVPGIFKKFTDESGLSYDVSISARNAATLRGQFLNTANAAWDLRGNVASQVWNTVVLQEQSDAALPARSSKNANLAQFNAYADRFERFIHNGAAQSYTESQLYGSLAACQATGASTTACNTVRNIPANPNASAATNIYLTETWARPDMVFAHKITTPDLTTSDGRPIVDTSSAGGDATLYYGSLAAMTADLHASFGAKTASNPRFAGVIPVGDAFQLAVNQGLVKAGAFYDANGIYVPNAPGDLMNLWWDDYLHASKYGSYLDALVQFGTITGLDPLSLGADEQAAADLGISRTDALTLQRIASEELAVAVPEPSTWALLAGGLLLVRPLGPARRGALASAALKESAMAKDLVDIKAAAQIYLDGLHEGNADKLASVFHPTSALTYEEGGELKPLARDEWLAAVRARPSPQSRGLARHDEILQIDQSSPTTAFVKLKCAIPSRYFTDYLCFLKIDGKWQVAQKIFATVVRTA